MKFENLRVGHINIPPTDGSTGSVQFLPTNQEQGGGFTLQGPREWLLKLVVGLVDLKSVTLTVEGVQAPEAPKEGNV